MERRTRKILLFVFLIIFLFTAPTLTFYLQGYRFDFERKSLTQTGGLFLKVIPKQAEIYLDGKLAKKTDFFFGSALIENLLPKKYHIKVKKEGYFSWEKDLEIKEKEVTEAKNLVLFPKNPNFNILTKEAKNSWFSSDGKKIILEERNGEFWALKLYDLDRNVKSHLLKEDDISKKGVELFNLKFSGNGKEIFLEVGTEEQLKYFTLEIDRTPPLLKETKEPLSPLKDIVAYQTLNNETYYLDNLGYLSKTDSSFSIKEKITELPFPLKQETGYELNIYPEFIFLQEGQILYLFNSDSKLFEKFFEGIRSSKISPDLKKLVYFSESEIWVLFLKEKMGRPKRKVGESIFLVRLSEKIKDVFWLNSNYLIFNAGDIIKIVEIDDRDKVNIIDLAEFKNPEIFFNKEDKKLYILTNGSLLFSENLIP
ncbi:MAG: hypothetical protein ACE5J0_03200 [Candidatus Paceibacterales bacterium]